MKEKVQTNKAIVKWYSWRTCLGLCLVPKLRVHMNSIITICHIHWLHDLFAIPWSWFTCFLWQVKLWCDCPFWPDDGMCRLRDCSVCECPENEFPEIFKKPLHRGLPSDDLVCQEGKPEATVDRTLDTRAFRGWMEVDNPWTNDDETDNSNYLCFWWC